jgi:hypothetical protein
MYGTFPRDKQIPRCRLAGKCAYDMHGYYVSSLYPPVRQLQRTAAEQRDQRVFSTKIVMRATDECMTPVLAPGRWPVPPAHVPVGELDPVPAQAVQQQELVAIASQEPAQNTDSA